MDRHSSGVLTLLWSEQGGQIRAGWSGMEARAWRARPRQDANSNRRGWFPAPTGVAGIHAGDRGVPVGGRSVRSLAVRPLPVGGSDRLGRHLRVHCRSAPRWPSSWRVSAGTGAAAGIPGRCPCSAGGSPSARDVVGELVDSYCEWLLRERGLAATTVRRYQATARRFLAQRAGGVDLNDLTAAEVSRVAAGVGWHDTDVPPRLSTDRIRSLLDSCDPVDPGRDPELFAITADRLEPVIAAAVSR